MSATYIATLHRNRSNQSVCIPKAMAFEGVDKVEISRVGNTVMLQPAKNHLLEARLKAIAQMEPCPDFEPCTEPVANPQKFIDAMRHGSGGDQ